MTAYNPKYKSKPFNYEPPQILTDISDDQRKQADEKLRDLIEDSHDQVFEEDK